VETLAAKDVAIPTGGRVAELRTRVLAVLKAEAVHVDFVAADFELFDVEEELGDGDAAAERETFDLTADDTE
jgi:hypothetical protein